MSSTPIRGQRPLTFAERTFLRTMTFMGSTTSGLAPAFLEEVLRQQGIFGFFRWSKIALQTFIRLSKHFGDRDVYFVAALASFWNGCTYCSYGEMFSFNLIWFKASGTLFPITEQDMFDLQSMPDDKGVQLLRERLSSPKYAPQLRILDELYAARQRADLPASDPYAQALHLYDFVNECSILYEAPAPPLSLMARERKLIERYQTARAAG